MIGHGVCRYVTGLFTSQDGFARHMGGLSAMTSMCSVCVIVCEIVTADVHKPTHCSVFLGKGMQGLSVMTLCKFIT